MRDYLEAWVVGNVADIFNSCVLLSIYRTLIIVLRNEILCVAIFEDDIQQINYIDH